MERVPVRPPRASHGFAPDRRDLEIERLRRLLEEARVREVKLRTEERERFSTLSSASKRFAASMRSRIDERRRTQRRLDAQYAAGRVLEGSRDLREAGPQVFRILAERLGWEAGVLWTLEEGALRCREVWRLRGLPPDGAASGFEEACRRSAFPRGAGLPGRVWAREEACWVEDVLEDGGDARGEAAAAEGLRCALAFPIQDGGRLVGVFELLREETGPAEEDALRAAHLLGQQIGQFVERRRAEEERDRLRRLAEDGRARLHAVLQQMPGGVFIAELGGSISLANEGAKSIYGREVRSIEECNRYALSYPEGGPIPPEDHPLNRALAGETVSMEHSVRRADGTRSIVSANAAPVLDEQGRVVAAVKAFQDVTELAEARTAIEESERRYRTLATNIPGAVFRATVIDGQPSMEFVSDRIEEITGYPAGSFILDRERSFAEVIHPEDSPNNEREVWRALERRGTYGIEYRVLHADGGVRWVNERGSGIFSEDGALLWVDGAIFDVTERRRVEEALRESEARQAFLLRLGDEIRPLTNPEEIQDTTGRLLGEHLGVDRAYHAEMDGTAESFIVHRDYRRSGAPSVVGTYPIEQLPVITETLRSGEPLVIADTGNTTLIPPAERGILESIEVRAMAAAPLVKRGRGIAALSVAQVLPRTWTLEEVGLIAEVAERTWDAVERARAEERLQLALEASDMGTFVWHAEEDRTESDARMLALFGLPAGGTLSLAEALGRLIHPDDRGGYAEAVARATDPAGAGALREDIRVVRPDGSVRWLTITGRTFFEAAPRRAVRMSGMAADVTERKRAEETLRESEERLRRVVEIETVGVVFFEADGRITDSNEAFLRMSGHDRGDLEGGRLRWDEVTPPEWMPRTRRAVEEIRETGGSAPYEKQYVRKDGSRRWGLFAGKRLDGSTSVEFVLDVTGRREAEEVLREYEAWLRIAQQAARSGTWEWDLTTGEIRWSAEHRELFGFDPSDEPLTREAWWAAVHPEDLPRIEEAGRRCSEDGEEWPDIEYRILHDGEIRWIDARGRTARDGAGRPLRILGISVDVTERKTAEEERDRLLAREWVSSAEAAERERISRELHDRVAHSMGVAHQSLQLYGVLAQKDAPRAAQKLELAKEMTKSALESTRNLSAELRHLEAEDDLEAELRHLLDVSVPPHVGTDLRVEGDETDVPGYVRGQVFLILREAVRNAVAHSGCASVSVGLDVRPEEIVGRVEDDGRSFDAGSGNGGVGLRSMRERAALLDGAFDLRCEPGRGTRVEISVPLKGGR